MEQKKVTVSALTGVRIMGVKMETALSRDKESCPEKKEEFVLSA